MKATITIERNTDGNYQVIVTLPNGTREYPQEGHTHDTADSAHVAIQAMYNSSTWQLEYNDTADNYTIEID